MDQCVLLFLKAFKSLYKFIEFSPSLSEIVADLFSEHAIDNGSVTIHLRICFSIFPI